MSHRPRTRSMHGLCAALALVLLLHPSSVRGALDLGGNSKLDGWDEFARISGAAQETRADPAVRDDVGAALARSGVRAGSTLRVRLRSNRTLEGPFARYEESRLVFADARNTDVPLAAIDSLWHETQWKNQAAMKGGIIGAIIGATTFAMLLSQYGSDELGAGTIGFTILSACVLGGSLGTLVALHGSAGSPAWTLLYARRPAAPTSSSLPAQPAP